MPPSPVLNVTSCGTARDVGAGVGTGVGAAVRVGAGDGVGAGDAWGVGVFVGGSEMNVVSDFVVEDFRVWLKTAPGNPISQETNPLGLVMDSS